jgi:FkbM family methyltransferase
MGHATYYVSKKKIVYFMKGEGQMLDECDHQETVTELKSRAGTFKMILERPGLIEDAIVHIGGWEIGLVSKLSGLLKDKGIFLDIGANIGYYTLYMARSFPNMKCIGFEPNPRTYEQFKRNVGVNQLHNVLAYDYAVGDVDGWTDFHVTGDTHYNKALSAVNYYEGLENDFKKISVKIVTLDNFLDDNMKKNVRAIKIDTQGFEYEVIRGALDLINQSKPIISFESHSCSKYTDSQIFNLIPDYKIYKIQAWSGEIRAYGEPDPPEYANDLLCIPPNMTLSI